MALCEVRIGFSVAERIITEEEAEAAMYAAWASLGLNYDKGDDNWFGVEISEEARLAVELRETVKGLGPKPQS